MSNEYEYTYMHDAKKKQIKQFIEYVQSNRAKNSDELLSKLDIFYNNATNN